MSELDPNLPKPPTLGDLPAKRIYNGTSGMLNAGHQVDTAARVRFTAFGSYKFLRQLPRLGATQKFLFTAHKQLFVQGNIFA
jgi:hypothetical protein